MTDVRRDAAEIRTTSAAPRRRADAERNAEAILDAAARCLSADPHVSMGRIAAEAGVTRVTLYAHVDSREALVEAVLGRALEETVAVLDGLDLDRGSAVEALSRLIASGWEQLDRFHHVFVAAHEAVHSVRVRAQHSGVIDRIDALVRRGLDAGEFRSPLPPSWLVSSLYELNHLAAREVAEARIDRDEAAGLLTTSALALLDADRPRP
jgi:AcrR family transcriptional regulator